jgi:hypothetical protein
VADPTPRTVHQQARAPVEASVEAAIVESIPVTSGAGAAAEAEVAAEAAGCPGGSGAVATGTLDFPRGRFVRQAVAAHVDPDFVTQIL